MYFLYFLAALNHFSQGISGLVSQPLYYYLREILKLSVPQIMYLMSLVTIPWMLKPLFGFFSDTFVIGSYRRKPYIFLSAIICSVMSFAIGFSPMLSLPLLILFLFCYSIGQAGDNVGINAFVVEHGNKTNTINKLQSVQWGSLSIAQIFTGILGGYLSTKYSYHFAYILIGIFPFTIAFASFFLKEDKVDKNLNSDKWKEIKEFFVKLKNKQLLLAIVFLFLVWFSPSIGTPLMNRMRENLHLSKMFIGWIGTIGSIFSLLGAAIYFKIGHKIDMKKWLYYSVILSTISTLAYLYTTRNSLIAYSVLFSISGQFIQLILLGFMARICQRGTEATTFALLTSIVNFGGSMSEMAGAKLYGLFGYDGLVIISSAATFVCLFFIPYLKIEKPLDKIL